MQLPEGWTPRRLVRWVFTLAPIAILLSTNVEKLYQDRGWDTLLSDRWTSIIAAVGDVTTVLTLAGIFSAGAAAALWLDAGLRGNEARAPISARLPRGGRWMVPDEALYVCMDDEGFSTYAEEHLADYNRRSRLADLARSESAANRDDKALEEEFTRLSAEASASYRLVEIDRQVRAENLQVWLEEGKAIARGVEVVGGIAQDERAIPKEYWRFLRMNPQTAEAGGQRRSYVGVRIARVNRPTARRRLPWRRGTAPKTTP